MLTAKGQANIELDSVSFHLRHRQKVQFTADEMDTTVWVQLKEEHKDRLTIFIASLEQAESLRDAAEKAIELLGGST